MQRREFLSQVGAAALLSTCGDVDLRGATLAESNLKRLSIDPASGGARAVKVGGVPLLHTPQIFAWNDRGEIGDSPSHSTQIETAFARLVETLKLGQSTIDSIVRLHIYATTNEIADQVRSFLNEHIPAASRPALTYVVGQLTEPGAVVGFDAVTVCTADPSAAARKTLLPLRKSWGRSASHQGILWPGRKLYISGQAEKGANLRECTRLTMESLRKTLQMFQLDMAHVVQIKSFVTPIAGKREVEDEIGRFFETDQLPPLVHVEWKSTLPIEIELIANVPAGMSEPVEFHTPKGMTSSPVFSRVALTNSREMIYTSGLYGKAGTGEEQVRDIFAQLRQVTAELGSDLRHLAKATYYVSDDDTSAKLNAVRPEFYDPKRPPAASKAIVTAVGKPDRSITLDMIAVPS